MAQLLVLTFRDTMVALIRRNGRELTIRQFAAFLVCYIEPQPQTVRGLAATLNIGTQAISHALNGLCVFGLVRRELDPQDRRSVLVQRTAKGRALMRELRAILLAGIGSASG